MRHALYTQGLAPVSVGAPTQANWRTRQRGLSMEQVRAIVGEPL